MPALWGLVPTYRTLLVVLLALLTLQSVVSVIMRFSSSVSPLGLLSSLPLGSASGEKVESQGRCQAQTDVSLKWHAPAKSEINDLDGVINGTGKSQQ